MILIVRWYTMILDVNHILITGPDAASDLNMSTRPMAKIEQPPATLRDMVQQRLREAIIEGFFQPGQRLVERPLCDQLGVSRTVIRETMRYLEAEGLVEILPGHGPIVAKISQEDARQIFDIRRKLETSAAETCARRITPDVAQTLRAALVSLQSEASAKDPGALFRATGDFYAAIFDGAGHNIAWEVVQRLNGRISRLRMMTLSTKDRKRPGIEHMERICTAIVSGDADAARQAVDEHLADTAAIADKLLAEVEEAIND